ncbi:acetyl-coenzyme A synthetase N-terminal domain-containing protein, partial [Amycolatopsis acididurans]|uniref:acetyl-coenzyme A synthetase N-terminal domain-containing protein n=1 Tax=Amycolatopsis acididurans TaxID=2724524 RepID=UPI0035E46102
MMPDDRRGRTYPRGRFQRLANVGPAASPVMTSREMFWAEQAERLHWDTRWSRVLDWSGAPFAKWFVGGKLNVAYNCV